jgi:hypothetical protein
VEVLERRLWCGILDLCTAPRPLQGGSYWVSFMFSEFLKFVFEKHVSSSTFSAFQVPDPWRCASRLPDTAPALRRAPPAGARLHRLANRAARRSDGRRPMMTKRAAPQWDGVDDRCAGRIQLPRRLRPGAPPTPTGAKAPSVLPGECAQERGGKFSWLQSLEKPQNGERITPESGDGNTDSRSRRLRRFCKSAASPKSTAPRGRLPGPTGA